MKLTMFVGTGSGKLGGSVFSVRGGKQIVRAYQPMVLNPKSVSQRKQRAKWKAAVQMSSVLGNVLYPFKQDAPANVSARNRFVQSLFNSGAVSYDEVKQQAEIDRSLIEISPSKIAWQTAENLTSSGYTTTGSVTVNSEFAGKGGVLTIVVLHKDIKQQPIVTAVKSFAVTQAQVQVDITASESFMNDDTILMVLALPVDNRLAATYRDIMWSNTDSAFVVPVVVSEYASAFRYLRSYNKAVTVAAKK